MTGALARYGAVLAVVCAGGAILLGLAFRGPGDSTAIWISAAVAIAVQLGAFVLARAAGRVSLAARMGAGAIVRFVALVAYALLAGLAFRLPLVAALISLASFFFVTSLLEPLLIRS